MKNLTRFKILNYLWLIYIKGDISSAKSVITRDFQTLKIETTKNKLLTQIDGEKFSHQNNITIQKSKKVFKFINTLISNLNYLDVYCFFRKRKPVLFLLIRYHFMYVVYMAGFIVLRI